MHPGEHPADGAAPEESCSHDAPEAVTGTQAGAQPQAPGPDMGQPHFSAQMPGAAPYQGAPVAGYPVWGYPMPPYPGYQPQPAYGPPPNPAQGPTQTPPQGPPPNPGDGHEPPGKGLENKYGELYGLIENAANGNADVSSFLRFFQGTSSDFWKGALVGAGLTLVLSNDTVKSTIAKGFAGIWGAVSRSAEDREAEEDRKAEQRAAKEA